MSCYYETLGLTEACTSEEVKRAYRKLALQHHPDKNGNTEEATARFQEIGNAYETLIDDELRRNYDARRPRYQPGKNREKYETGEQREEYDADPMYNAYRHPRHTTCEDDFEEDDFEKDDIFEEPDASTHASAEDFFAREKIAKQRRARKKSQKAWEEQNEARTKDYEKSARAMREMIDILSENPGGAPSPIPNNHNKAFHKKAKAMTSTGVAFQQAIPTGEALWAQIRQDYLASLNPSEAAQYVKMERKQAILRRKAEKKAKDMEMYDARDMKLFGTQIWE